MRTRPRKEEKEETIERSSAGLEVSVRPMKSGRPFINLSLSQRRASGTANYQIVIDNEAPWMT
eukprot:7879257-Pyramimonas_sp.AAC.1